MKLYENKKKVQNYNIQNILENTISYDSIGTIMDTYNAHTKGINSIHDLYKPQLLYKQRMKPRQMLKKQFVFWHKEFQENYCARITNSQHPENRRDFYE